jgi:hypothetical protein
VASNLGMAIVPDVSVAIDVSDFIVRPLRPSLSRTLALIEHRNKPNEPALEIVRNALLALRTVGAIEPQDVQASTQQAELTRVLIRRSDSAVCEEPHRPHRCLQVRRAVVVASL